jgi:hypothetical protein
MTYKYEPCGECDKGFIPVKTDRGLRYRRCDCENGLRLKFTGVPDSLLDAILNEKYWTPSQRPGTHA